MDPSTSCAVAYVTSPTGLYDAMFMTVRRKVKLLTSHVATRTSAFPREKLVTDRLVEVVWVHARDPNNVEYNTTLS